MSVVYFPTIKKVLFGSLASPSQAVWITLQSAARLKRSGRCYFLHDLVRGIRVWGIEGFFCCWENRRNVSESKSFILTHLTFKKGYQQICSDHAWFISLPLKVCITANVWVCVSVCIVYNMLIAKHNNISVSLQEQATAPSSCLQRAVCWLNRRCCTGGRRMCGATLDHV